MISKWKLLGYLFIAFAIVYGVMIIGCVLIGGFMQAVGIIAAILFIFICIVLFDRFDVNEKD